MAAHAHFVPYGAAHLSRNVMFGTVFKLLHKQSPERKCAKAIHSELHGNLIFPKKSYNIIINSKKLEQLYNHYRHSNMKK